MATQTLTIQQADDDALFAAVAEGDLSKLTKQQKLSYYSRRCKELGLNPLNQPFSWLVLNGKVVLYANRSCTEELRSNRDISVSIVSREMISDCYVVTAKASMPSGRTDESTGVVALPETFKGDIRANAMLKAETKAKRRVTLSICGLGILDETEVETIKSARPVTLSSRIVTGIIDQIKVTDHGVTGIKIGEEKLWVTDVGIDAQLAAAEGQDVAVEVAERPGIEGKKKPFWEITKVLRIRNYDFTDADNLAPQLEASVEVAAQPSSEPTQTSTQTVEAPGKAVQCIPVKITKVMTRTKAPFRRIEVLTNDGLVEMSVWHKSFYPILDRLQKTLDLDSQQCGNAIIEYSTKTDKDNKVWTSLERIIELDGAPFVEEKDEEF